MVLTIDPITIDPNLTLSGTSNPWTRPDDPQALGFPNIASS